MTRDQIVAQIIGKFAGDNYFPLTQIYGLINNAIDIMGAETPLRVDFVTFKTKAGQREYNLPHNISRVNTVECQHYLLDRISYEEACNLFDNYDVVPMDNLVIGPPEKYYIRESVFTDPTLDAPDLTGIAGTDTTGTNPYSPANIRDTAIATALAVYNASSKTPTDLATYQASVVSATNAYNTAKAIQPQGDPLNPAQSTTSRYVIGIYPCADDAHIVKVSGAFRPPHLSEVQATGGGQSPAFPPEFHQMIIDYVVSQLKETDNEDPTAGRYYSRFEEKLNQLRHRFYTDDDDRVTQIKEDTGDQC